MDGLYIKNTIEGLQSKVNKYEEVLYLIQDKITNGSYQRINNGLWCLEKEILELIYKFKKELNDESSANIVSKM